MIPETTAIDALTRGYLLPRKHVQNFLKRVRPVEIVAGVKYFELSELSHVELTRLQNVKAHAIKMCRVKFKTGEFINDIDTQVKFLDKGIIEFVHKNKFVRKFKKDLIFLKKY